MTARTLMVQGTCSSAGKSLLVAALCRIYARRGVRVAPFKAQNMSNNAAVCGDGAEIGRSQALQAEAAGVEPSADMNPILLKPEADNHSQVIVNGRPWQSLAARPYFRARHELWPVVTDALDRLRARHELVVIEGAGSPAELNLRHVEIVNMAVARYARSPVLLAGDIERGGVFAQLLGTLWLLDDEDRGLVRGLIVNKFRGDRSLFDAGVTELETRGGVPVLGVVPWLADLNLPEEDAVALDGAGAGRPHPGSGGIEIAVIRLPRISNFDDFDPLAAEPGVRVRFVERASELRTPAAIILPGTKSTVADLAWLRERGLAERIVGAAERGTAVVGICGGYQMLGRTIRDPGGAESSIAQAAGLGLLPLETEFRGSKTTHRVQAVLEDDRHAPGSRGTAIDGYEIHMGQSHGGRSWLRIAERSGQPVHVPDGGVSQEGRTWGCYIHGLFANATFRRAWLRTLGWVPGVEESPAGCGLDRLADAVEGALDMRRVEAMLEEQDVEAVR